MEPAYLPPHQALFQDGVHASSADKHLLASRHSLVEGANASLKKANTDTIDATRADIAGIGHSGSLAIQADGASIDHPGSPTCESADDGKCSTLTPGTPADQDEVALAVVGSATDRSDGDQLEQSSEMPSKNFKNSDVERSYGSVHVYGRATGLQQQQRDDFKRREGTLF
ncbi:hypothetical protein HPB52_000076 [Rhipicephalus sanguineus]|uniref:Uncharacterized protein n=1 Tax=Rhipicephalus sanguineus TaxID=34632 RepID=A0A9D4PTC5_RHISA|nr:hypothetical protein HPB52_000076 [Rhipicephalus sanguineus]